MLQRQIRKKDVRPLFEGKLRNSTNSRDHGRPRKQDIPHVSDP